MPLYPAQLPTPLSIANGGTGSSTAAAARTALGVGTADTPTFAAINLGDTNLSDYVEGTFSPTVTLVGGAGNTVPVYVTNNGRHTRIGRMELVDIYLNGDGGAEGAGTGQINIALPVTAIASHDDNYFPCGTFTNGSTQGPLLGRLLEAAQHLGCFITMS